MRQCLPECQAGEDGKIGSRGMLREILCGLLKAFRYVLKPGEINIAEEESATECLVGMLIHTEMASRLVHLNVGSA